ncbi:MAG: rRNA maturation RNase YbeY [Verrucomicrobiae bacterium]|nr:rRNA maturation RNase YbeY [Verrucomicrobiae bacterium]NNJ42965.1 rRNA maturation RNase YbeY [Akkermansiaceae bacterium]
MASSRYQTPELNVYCHQRVVDLSPELMLRLELAGRAALPKALAVATCPDSALSRLDEVEVSIIDDATIADVHLRFMDIAGATDVITFDHGEIHISVETARSQAAEFGNAFERELMLYLVHGLLHLAGHEDATDSGRALMDQLQLSILKEVW